MEFLWGTNQRDYRGAARGHETGERYAEVLLEATSAEAPHGYSGSRSPLN